MDLVLVFRLIIKKSLYFVAEVIVCQWALADYCLLICLANLVRGMV